MHGAGHLVHMPAHIYLRVGRYNEASVAKPKRDQGDAAYFAGDAVRGKYGLSVGYYPHNIHFSS